jgi:hypothetical protein
VSLPCSDDGGVAVARRAEDLGSRSFSLKREGSFDMTAGEILLIIDTCLGEYQDRLNPKVLGTRPFEKWRVEVIVETWEGNHLYLLTEEDVRRTACKVLQRLCDLPHDFFMSEPELDECVTVVRGENLIVGFATGYDAKKLTGFLTVAACPSRQ